MKMNPPIDFFSVMIIESLNRHLTFQSQSSQNQLRVIKPYSLIKHWMTNRRQNVLRE